MKLAISLKHIEFFVKIVECGGLSEAAVQLNVSPSAVSKRLSDIEDILGTTLIKRTTRSLSLTDAGQYLFQRANVLLQEFDDTLNTTSSFYQHPQGELRITCSIAFGYAWLMSLVNKYRKKYPDVNFYIDLNDNFVNLNEADFDLALRVTSAPPENYAIRKLALIRWAYCASPNYLARKKIPKSHTDLIYHDCLIYPGITPLLKNKLERFNPNQAKIRTSVQANSSLVLLKSVLEDQGIGYLPTYLIADYIQNKMITPLILDNTFTYPTHNLYALYFPTRYSNPKVRSFIDFLLKELGDIPIWDRWLPSDSV